MIKLDKIPAINMKKTGENIKRLRKENNISVRDIQDVFGFMHRSAIYKWEDGTHLPSIDNLVVLSSIFNKSINEILIVDDR